MADNDFSAESPQNYEQKSICCFVIDVSGSMSGQPIEELNEGLQEFHREISQHSMTANRLEVAVIEFSDTVETVVEPSLAQAFTMPRLSTKGTTKLVDGVREAIGLVEARKGWYKQTGQPYLRPWIILITDGGPDSDQDVSGLTQDIQNGMHNKKYVFLAVGVQDANMGVLERISSSMEPGGKRMGPAKLQGLKFFEFFKWMSASMAGIAGSKEGEKMNLPSTQDWTEGYVVS